MNQLGATTGGPSGGDEGVRDRLALARTRLANERTLLAYARTAIMLLATGGTLLKLFADSPSSVIAGWALVGVGTGVAALGAYRYQRLARSLR